jgi:hypothetical protein
MVRAAIRDVEDIARRAERDGFDGSEFRISRLAAIAFIAAAVAGLPSPEKAARPLLAIVDTSAANAAEALKVAMQATDGDCEGSCKKPVCFRLHGYLPLFERCSLKL